MNHWKSIQEAERGHVNTIGKTHSGKKGRDLGGKGKNLKLNANPVHRENCLSKNKRMARPKRKRGMGKKFEKRLEKSGHKLLFGAGGTDHKMVPSDRQWVPKSPLRKKNLICSEGL